MTSLDQVLETLPAVAGASVVKQLSDGPTNASFLLARDSQRLVLRLDKPAARALGLDRRNEQQVLNVLAGAGLTPAPLYCDVSNGILLRPYLEGFTWTPQQLNDESKLQALARLLRRVHSVEPTGARFDPMAAARRYARQSGAATPDGILERAGQLASELAGWPEPPVLCHNDPVCHNILEGETVLLIDWEYSAVGDRYFDLAVVSGHHGLDDALSAHLLESYLGRVPVADERRHLQQHCRFYACLLRLWEAAVA